MMPAIEQGLQVMPTCDKVCLGGPAFGHLKPFAFQGVVHGGPVPPW